MDVNALIEEVLALTYEQKLILLDLLRSLSPSASVQE